MSTSLKRVKAALEMAGLTVEISELLDGTRTANDAAAAVGCEVDQIAKSILFRDTASGKAIVFITAGGNQVCAEKASALVGAPLEKADAALIRAQTGFAIGGVAPIGHLESPSAFIDPRLFDFPQIWAAAGTPRHVFASNAQDIQNFSDAQLADFIK